MSIPATQVFSCVIIASLMLVFPACKSGDSANSEETVQDTSKEIVWDWETFPQSSEMLMSSLPVHIQPKESFEIQSEAPGIITLEVDEKVTQVEKGLVIARMNVDTLKELAERLTIEEEKQIMQDVKAEKLDLPEKRKMVKKELEEARRKVKMIELVLNNPAMDEYAKELFGGNIGELNDKALEEAQEALRLAEMKMAWAEEFGEKIRKGEQRIQEMDLTKNKRNYEETKDRAVYTTPFSGELRLEVNYVAGQKEYTVVGRETIATLNNFDEIHAHLKVGSAKWVNLQPKQLYVQLHDPDKTIMNFSDDRIERDLRTRREERKYIFSIPMENNKVLKRLVGTQMNSDLVYKLPTRCYIVPKYDLSLYALGKTDSTEWSVIVNQLWPEVKVIAEGHKYLALARPAAKLTD